MVICLEQGADLHVAQLMPLPLTVSCFSKILIGFAFLIPAHRGSPGQRAVKRVCVCMCVRCVAPKGKGENDYRPLFDIFVNDLLTMTSMPEWPAADLMLMILGGLLVCVYIIYTCLKCQVCLSK